MAQEGRSGYPAGERNMFDNNLSTFKDEARYDLGIEKKLRLRNKPYINYTELDSESEVSPTKEKDDDWEQPGSVSDVTEEMDTSRDSRIDDCDDIEITKSMSTPLSGLRSRHGHVERRAAKDALRKVRAMQAPDKTHRAAYPPLTPEMRAAAHAFYVRPPIFLKPLPLSEDRVKIHRGNVDFFAEDGAADPWTSALSSTRFGGPRKHPPWRELHRLTDPDENDGSDWAENIRWAKEQFRLFGSVWTEYDYSLSTIEKHRRSTLWVSEEVIGSGFRLRPTCE